MLFNFKRNWKKLEVGDTVLIVTTTEFVFSNGNKLGQGTALRWPVVRKEDGCPVIERNGVSIICSDNVCDERGIRQLEPDPILPSGGSFLFTIEFADPRSAFIGSYAFDIEKDQNNLVITGGASSVDGSVITSGDTPEKAFLMLADAYLTLFEVRLTWWRKLLWKLLI